jgi:hypothetical protein
MQLGEADEAYRALMRCIELSPEGDGTPYLNLAQISEGLEALGYYNKGIELLVKKRAALFAEVRASWAQPPSARMQPAVPTAASNGSGNAGGRDVREGARAQRSDRKRLLRCG